MSSLPIAARRKGTAGFALIEVLVAVAIAAVILTALLRVFVTTWTGINTVREEAEAMLLARAIVDIVAPRDKTGEASQNGIIGRYAWSLAVTRAPDMPALDADAESEPGSGLSWTLYRIAVVVTAPSGRRTNLETYRLGKAAR